MIYTYGSENYTHTHTHTHKHIRSLDGSSELLNSDLHVAFLVWPLCLEPVFCTPVRGYPAAYNLRRDSCTSERSPVQEPPRTNQSDFRPAGVAGSRNGVESCVRYVTSPRQMCVLCLRLVQHAVFNFISEDVRWTTLIRL